MEAERRVALAALLHALPSARVRGDTQQSITGIVTASGAVRPGSLFVAVRGTQTDGHRFLSDAVVRGAAAVVVEQTQEPALGASGETVTVIGVPDTRLALSALAASFYGDPSQTLDVIGVTGTNGKTTTTRMIAAICRQAGVPCGIVGTVGAEFGGQRWQLENTTPLPPELHGLLATMRAMGAAAVAMEVSSHSLALDRVADVRFGIAALTNVTRDHLDFHRDEQSYAAAKRRLFSLARRCVLNADDRWGAQWARELAAQGRATITYGAAGATLVPRGVEVSMEGSSFAVDGQKYVLHLPGRFNVHNALAAIGVARFLGIDDATAARGLAEMGGVPGRMERQRARGIDVIVDYAHTPDALEHALRALRETAGGSLAVVFGCGGDRDRGKRPQMGAVAAELADRIYLTSDNPRSEDPRAIVDAITAGIGAGEHIIELDRRLAIERAIREASPGDVVLVAGKGHEAYQIVGDRVLPFDDAAVVREALARR
jgi:UDP-N-acetylmuramoyl-L-alanyl-D-glutamate--2,6-diaminopimelate ligase